MSRWFFPWSSSIKKRACRYLLQHYLGHFFEERLSLDQLSLDLYNGSGSIRDIHLDIWSVNELLDSMGTPLEIIDGFVGSISVTIPWSALVTENCTVEVTGLQVTCRPRYRSAHGTEFQSWSSMTTSMQLAQECLKEQPEEPLEPTQPLEGLEMFAQTIETVLRRIKVTFVDTIIRVEHVPDRCGHGVALEMHIKRLEYCDEAVKDSSHTIPVDIHQPPAFIHKILQLSGVNLYYEEFLNRSCTPPATSVPQEMDSSCSSVDESRTFTEAHSRSVEPVSNPPLQIGTCTGFMEMTVKLKQNEAFPGPKLELDGRLGSLHLLLTPKQMSYLQDLLDAVSTSEVNSLKDKMIKSRPIVSEDMKLIEQDLSKQLHSGQSFSQSLHECPDSSMNTENGDMFYSMNPMTSSVTSIRSASELSDDLDTSVISEYSSYRLQTPSLATGLIVNSPRRFGNFPFSATLPHPQNLNKRPGKTPCPPHVETVKLEMLLKVTLGGITLTVLQHDPECVLSDSSDCSLNSSLSRTAQHFFTELAYFKDTAFSEQDFNHLRPKFEKACFQSNLRLTGAAVQILYEQKASTSVQMMNVDLCFRTLEILECLWTKTTTTGGMQQKMEYTEILMFKNPGAFINASPPRPCAQIHYKWTQKNGSKSAQKKPSFAQNAELFVEFMEFHSEVDLGILDRMSSLLSFALTGTNELSMNMKMSYEQQSVPSFSGSCIDPLSLTERQVTVQVTSPNANFKLLFPIPDLRPESECRHWMEKAVRGEYLTLEFTDIDFKTEFNTAAKTEPVKLEAVFSDLHGLYKDGEKPGVSCIRACKVLDPLSKGTGKKYIFPKIVVIINPDSTTLNWDLLMEKMDDIDPCSVESPCELKQPDASPFSSKRTMYETEEMVIPGDTEEMAEFKKKTLAMSQYVLDVTLPSAFVFFPSKEFYESIYNRINNDLLMWEPRVPPCGKDKAPIGVPVPGHPFFNTVSGSVYKQDNFRLCKSAFKLDSDSEDDDAQFYSTDVVAQKRKAEQRAHSFLSAVVNIKKGRLSMLTDAKNESGKKLEDSHGELVLDIENGTVFSVSQFKGQLDLSYLCIESDKVALYHKAVIEDYLLPEKLEVPNFNPVENLNPIIYCSEDGVMAKLSAGRKDRSPNMLSATIKISLDTKKNIKEFLVALRLQAATVRHHMALANQSWHAQLIDFFDVIDDPVLGYIPPTVITVLHTHLFCCALDYRPLYLPVRVVITVETFTLSSNIIVDTSTFHLRFILDDSAVYLSDKCEAETVELRKDYVCVLDVDLLKLVVTTWKGSSNGKLTQPLFDLRCSNNVVHLHTCADSCAMLINLIQYVVNSGDLHPPPKQESPTEIAGQKLQLSESPASLPPCLPAETAEINQGDLADALMDNDRNIKDLSLMSGEMVVQRQNSPVSVYLFPGENRTAERPHSETVTSGATMDGLDSFLSDGSEVESDSTDNDDFCILDAPGMGIPAKDGEPSVTRLVDGPISVKDGHFSRPLGSTDLLKAPVRFPMPETRIMLREISVVWHLYGGKDFGVTRSSSAPSPRIRSGSASARSSPSRTSVTNRPQNTWRTQGGTGRVHDILMEIQLTKVSFQHEAYPTSNALVEKGLAEHSGPEVVEQPVARQVFIVQELEIRDRLASSQINKFLYLYTSEKMPRRAHSNMLTIKALHVHPESGLGGQECYLRVSLMPLRLNIDQDALFFLKDFFTNLATGINPVIPVEVGTDALKSDVSQRSSLTLDPEVTNKEMEPGQSLSAKGQDMTASVDTTISENSSSSTASSSTDQPIFFREFRFTSEVPIWLDYQGKHVTVDQVGTFAGIMIGLAQLNCSELKLKRLCCRHGLLGVDKVVNYALNEWLSDIKKNQLPGILGGVGPIHSVVQLFHGVRDLFWMPIEQYRKDGRIIRGIQRGAASFGTSTASAALELSNRLVQAIQATAETVYDILSPTPPIARAIMDKRHTRRHKRAQQPADIREGVVKAYDTVREGVIDTAQTICDVATRGHEEKGITGAVGGVLRQIPPTVVKPLIVATEATSSLLGGMRNQIKPDARKEDFLKWRLDEIQE